MPGNVKHVLWSVLYLVLLGILPSVCEAVPVQLKKARKLYGVGKKLVSQKKFKAATPKFEEAAKLIHQLERAASSTREKQNWRTRRAGILYILARVYQSGKQYIKARSVHLKVVELVPKQKLTAKAKAQIKKIETQYLAMVNISTSPAKADIVLEGKLSANVKRKRRIFMGRSPLKRFMPPGDYQLTIKSVGYKDIRRAFPIRLGSLIELSYILQKKSAPKPEKKVIKPVKRVQKPKTRPTNRKVAKVPVVERPVVRRRGATTPRGVPVRTSLASGLIWGGLVGMILTGTGGGILLGYAQGEFGWVEDAKGKVTTSNKEFNERLDRANNAHLFGWILVGTAGASAVALLVGLLLPKKDPASAKQVSTRTYHLPTHSNVMIEMIWSAP